MEAKKKRAGSQNVCEIDATITDMLKPIIIITTFYTLLLHQGCLSSTGNAEFLDFKRFAMAQNKNTVISAQVVLRCASGKSVDPNVAITAENLAEFAPSTDTVASATEMFRSRGFEVGLVVGVSFSVTGTLRAFEEFFGIQIQLGKDGAYEFMAGNKPIGHELSGKELPEALRNLADFVVFPLPPDFGPTNF